MKNNLLRILLGAALVCLGLTFAGSAQADSVTPNQVLTGTNYWYRTNIYTLNGGVFVMTNSVLNIEAGTVIKGHNLGGQGTNVGALYICRGGKIFAEGTPHHPIIFTADIDDTTDPFDMDIWGPNARGHWGGVVLFGNARLNSAVDNTGDASSPIYEAFEGLDPNFTLNGDFVFRFGGSDDNDNSGVMRYVSIRHGGTVLAPNKELNGLSFAGVGRGTTIEYIEAYCAADDGFEFFGGTVNTKYLVSAFNDDDMFDADQGYSGTNQFWFGIQAPDKRNYGMELNNQVNERPQDTQRLPAADFKVYNMTLIGAGALDTTPPNGGEDAGITLRPWVGPKIYNSIFTDFAGRGIFLDTQQGIVATQAVTGGYAQLHSTIWWDFVTGSGNGLISNTATNLGRGTVATNYWTDLSLTNQIVNPQITSISRTNDGSKFLDPRPKSGSPAYSNTAATPGGGFLTPTDYQGAFGSNDLWIAHWTALWEYGIVQHDAVHTNFPNQILTGTNYWYRTNIYFLNGGVFVMTNSVLHIEAGTVIKGHNLGGQGTNVGALYICRGGKIFAEGTPQNPIIFTADIDDTEDPFDMDIWGPNARGHWGGVVLFGNARLNSAVDNTGDASSPIYEAFEGLDPNFTLNGDFVFRFGGSDDNDNSGVMRYVSIRHGGTVLAPNKELNGLSFAGVGRGTTIEYIEAYCAADDGFEFFGGTVNTKYLVSAFNDDDMFDADQGYSGTNQFWFGIQAPDKRNYGMELNNQVNERPQDTQRLPAADFKVYNMTLIGAGALNTTPPNGGEDAGITLRPWVGPKIYNSIFTDFAGRGIFLDTQQGIIATQAVTGGYAQLHSTIWWDFVTGSGNGLISNTATNLGRGTVATNYWTDLTLTNEIVNPQLINISRTNDGTAFLDPRTAAGSPAGSNVATAPTGLVQVSYRGAFGSGRTDWASDWTALSEYSILGGAGGNNPQPQVSATVVTLPSPPTLKIVVTGASVDISFTTQTGFSYQLQTNGLITGVWGNSGGAASGTGGTVTLSQPASNSEQYFRVLAY